MLSLFYSSTTSRFQSTPSEGRATQSLVRLPRPVDISIHALRGEGDDITSAQNRWLNEFQSTPSEGRATALPFTFLFWGGISIHALRGEGDGVICHSIIMSANFNPRPPRGGRHNGDNAQKRLHTFQSTPSEGRATRSLFPRFRLPHISIHALRGEGDILA